MQGCDVKFYSILKKNCLHPCEYLNEWVKNMCLGILHKDKKNKIALGTKMQGILKFIFKKALLE